MLVNKTFLLKAVISSLLLTSAVAANASVTIDNRTTKPSTTIVNGGGCSKSIPFYGVTEPGAVNTIPDYLMNLSCRMNKEACSAVIYMSRDCSGNPVATLTLNTVTNTIKSAPQDTSSVAVEVDGTTVLLKETK